MARYMKGVVPATAPIDHEHHLRPVYALGLARNSRALQIAQEMVRHCRADGSAISFSREIAAWLRFCRASGIEPLKATPIDVDRYVGTLSNYAMGTQHLKLLVARLFYTRAIGHHWLRDNPVVIPRSIRRIPETDTPALTQAQAELLLSSIAAEFDDPMVGLTAKRDYSLVLLSLRLAVRASESGDLRWGRISESNGEKRISFRRKGSKPTTMLVPADLWEVLEKWRRAYEAATGATLYPGDPIFLGVRASQLRAAGARKGQTPLPPLSRGAVYHVVATRLGDINIKGDRYGPHCLRATAAVLSYLGGSSIIEIQALLGHSAVQTTMRYLTSLMNGASGPAINNIKLTVPDWDEGLPAESATDEPADAVA
jgi:integrase